MCTFAGSTFDSFFAKQFLDSFWSKNADRYWLLWHAFRSAHSQIGFLSRPRLLSMERCFNPTFTKDPPKRLFDTLEGLVVAGCVLHELVVSTAPCDFESLAPLSLRTDGFVEHVLDVFPCSVIRTLHWLAHDIPVIRVAPVEFI